MSNSEKNSPNFYDLSLELPAALADHLEQAFDHAAILGDKVKEWNEGKNKHKLETDPWRMLTNVSAARLLSLVDYYTEGRGAHGGNKYGDYVKVVGEDGKTHYKVAPKGSYKSKETTYPMLVVYSRYHGKVIGLYRDFIIEDVQEPRQEIAQILQTFDETMPAITFFGAKVPVFKFSGKLLNFADKPWRDRWFHYYHQFLRGSRAVRLGLRIFVFYDGSLYEGYLLGFTQNQKGQQNGLVPFSFSVLILRQARMVVSTRIVGDNNVVGEVMYLDAEDGGVEESQDDEPAQDENNPFKPPYTPGDLTQAP